MNCRSSLPRVALATLGTSVALAAIQGCATATQDEARAPARHHVSGKIVDRTYEFRQLGSGDDAYFARCLPPACPQPTPKTLASLEAKPASPEVLAVAAFVTPAAQVEQAEAAIVHFEIGSSKLDRRARSTLAQFAAIARQSKRIVVSGRTDSTGSEELNMRLAQARALAVASYLRQSRAAVPGQIEIDARGRCCYAAGNELESGRQVNRRAEVSFYPYTRDAQ